MQVRTLALLWLPDMSRVGALEATGLLPSATLQLVPGSCDPRHVVCVAHVERVHAKHIGETRLPHLCSFLISSSICAAFEASMRAVPEPAGLAAGAIFAVQPIPLAESVSTFNQSVDGYKRPF